MKVLVTGGSGFLGLEICRRLSARGDVTSSLHRRPSSALQQLGVHQHLGDLTDSDAVSRAVAGCDAVIHNAALAGVSGPPRPYWATNVVGTRHVIEQCRAHGVRTLLYTSTASVVFRPGGLEGVTESLPPRPVTWPPIPPPRPAPRPWCWRPTARSWPPSHCARTSSGAPATPISPPFSRAPCGPAAC